MFSLRNTSLALLITLGVAAVLARPTAAQEKSIMVASTTEAVDTGLFDYLLPIFTQKTGIAVNPLAVGTGVAFDIARHGEADVVFVHAKIQELQFIGEGEGVRRYPVMYDDFVLVGPKSDPAHIVGMDDVAEAFRKIKTEQAPSYRAATARAPTMPNSPSGTKTQASISRRKEDPGTRRPDEA